MCTINIFALLDCPLVDRIIVFWLSEKSHETYLEEEGGSIWTDYKPELLQINFF